MPGIHTSSGSGRDNRQIVAVVVQQHLDDAAILYSTRTQLSSAPHVKLRNLGRFDDRLAAHLDGLSVAGDACKPMCDAALEGASAGALFVATTRALESKDTSWLQQLLALTEAAPESRSGLLAAFGWMERGQLQGVVADLLRSANAFHRMVGVAACAMHRVDPGLGPARLLEHPDPLPRARAYRTAGELGKREFLSYLGGIKEDDPECQFWSAWAAVLLGDRERALARLVEIGLQPGPHRARAFRTAMLAISVTTGHDGLRSLAQDPANIRWLMTGTGLVGDPTYIPWLIKHMADDKVARLAGESFSWITGLDLAWLDLERKPPEGFESGPSDNPDDANVAMDEDESLPWPDPAKILAWWDRNGAAFTPGVRHFMGAALTREHCIDVLNAGFQRQRIGASLHRTLLEPGVPLFDCRAPSRRQQRVLIQI